MGFFNLLHAFESLLARSSSKKKKNHPEKRINMANYNATFKSLGHSHVSLF